MYVKLMCKLIQDESINLHLSSINFSHYALKRSSQNRNPEISVKLHYLFVESTTNESEHRHAHFFSWHHPPPPPPIKIILYPPQHVHKNRESADVSAACLCVHVSFTCVCDRICKKKNLITGGSYKPFLL